MIFEIDLKKLENNFNYLKKNSDKISCVVKSDAYGFGAVHVAETLYNLGCTNFCVGGVFEGVDLRQIIPNNIEIICLNGFFEEFSDLYISNKVTPAIISLEQLHKVKNYNIPFWLFLDTGLNRTGISMEEATNLDLDNYNIVGVMTHFLTTKYDVFCEKQLETIHQFNQKYKKFPQSILKSSAIPLGNKFQDLARFGHSLYFNLSPNMQSQDIGKIFSEIIKIQHIKKGDCVGYDQNFQAETDMQIGLINSGYATGLDATHPHVFYDGIKCKILGKVSMELTSIDLSEVPDAKTGHFVNVFGKFLDTAKIIGCSTGYLTTKLNFSKVKRKYFY